MASRRVVRPLTKFNENIKYFQKLCTMFNVTRGHHKEVGFVFFHSLLYVSFLDACFVFKFVLKQDSFNFFLWQVVKEKRLDYQRKLEETKKELQPLYEEGKIFILKYSYNITLNIIFTINRFK